MVGRVGVEPTSPVFQTGAVTTLATAPSNLERETGFEPAASSLARRRSTTELFPQTLVYYNKECGGNRKDFRHLSLKFYSPWTLWTALAKKVYLWNSPIFSNLLITTMYHEFLQKNNSPGRRYEVQKRMCFSP